jgi:hypothetical protein
MGFERILIFFRYCQTFPGKILCSDLMIASLGLIFGG